MCKEPRLPVSKFHTLQSELILIGYRVRVSHSVTTPTLPLQSYLSRLTHTRRPQLKLSEAHGKPETWVYHDPDISKIGSGL